MTTPDLRATELKAALAAAAGSISVGFVPFFVTGLQHTGMDTVSILLFRYLVALAILYPLALWTLGGLRAEWHRGGRRLFVNGLSLGAFQTYCYFRAVETLATSVVVTIFYCYPVFALILDRLIFKFRVRWTTLLAVVVVVSGVAAMSLPGFAGAALDPTGLLFAALSPVGYAVYIAVAYPATRRVSALASASFIYTSMAVTFGLAVLAQGLTVPARPELWLNLAFIGTLGGALQIASFAFALPRLSSSGYALIVCLEVVTVVLAGVLLLGERLVAVQWLGIALVLGGILLERLTRMARPLPAQAEAPAVARQS